MYNLADKVGRCVYQHLFNLHLYGRAYGWSTIDVWLYRNQGPSASQSEISKLSIHRSSGLLIRYVTVKMSEL